MAIHPLEAVARECLALSSKTDNIWFALAAHNCAIAIRRMPGWSLESKPCQVWSLDAKRAIDALERAREMLAPPGNQESEEVAIVRRKAVGSILAEAQRHVGW
jgi:hypothetical protein